MVAPQRAARAAITTLGCPRRQPTASFGLGMDANGQACRPARGAADGCHLPDASGVFEHQPLSACRSQHGLVCGQHLVQRRGELLGLGIAKGKRQRGEAAPRHDHTAPQQRLVSVERKA